MKFNPIKCEYLRVTANKLNLHFYLFICLSIRLCLYKGVSLKYKQHVQYTTSYIDYNIHEKKKLTKNISPPKGLHLGEDNMQCGIEL